MKEHEVKLLLVTVFFVVAITLISGMPTDVCLLVLIANILAHILLVLCRMLNVLKEKGGEK